MTVRLTPTAAGLAALADGTHRATRAVQMRRLAVGTGTTPAGTDDSARNALRAQREIGALTGDTSTPARIAVRADFTPDAAYDVTEVGLFARIGAGPEFLFAYWAGATSADAIASASSGVRLVVVGIVQIVASAADVTVTMALNISVGAPGAATTERAGLVELATDTEAASGRDGARAVTPTGLAARTPAASTTRRGLVELATSAEAQAGSDTTRAVTPGALAARTPAASTSRRGLVELATSAEAQAGSDTTRAVTPGALAARTPAASTSRRGLVELATSAEAQAGRDGTRAVTPAGLAAGVAARTPAASTVRRGLVELATSAEAQAGRDGARAVTPAGLAAGVAARTPAASTVRRGLVELATSAEAQAGRDGARAVTPAGLAARTPAADTTRRGLVELATREEAAAGTRVDVAVTPDAMRSAFFSSMSVHTSLHTDRDTYFNLYHTFRDYDVVWLLMDTGGAPGAVANAWASAVLRISQLLAATSMTGIGSVGWRLTDGLVVAGRWIRRSPQDRLILRLHRAGSEAHSDEACNIVIARSPSAGF